MLVKAGIDIFTMMTRSWIISFIPHTGVTLQHTVTCMPAHTVHYIVSPKTMTAITFNTFQVCECLLGSPPSFVHTMTAPNFKSSSLQPEIVEN